jgi:hypothetical protein
MGFFFYMGGFGHGVLPCLPYRSLRISRVRARR